jgi:hypothetical protein
MTARLQKVSLSIRHIRGNECLVRVSFPGVVQDPSHQIDDQNVEKIVSRLGLWKWRRMFCRAGEMIQRSQTFSGEGESAVQVSSFS